MGRVANQRVMSYRLLSGGRRDDLLPYRCTLYSMRILEKLGIYIIAMKYVADDSKSVLLLWYCPLYSIILLYSVSIHSYTTTDS